MKYIFILFCGINFILILSNASEIAPLRNNRDFVITKNLLSIAKHYLNENNYKKAGVIYKDILSSDKKNYFDEEARFNLIEVLFKNGNIMEAKSGYQSYILEFPFGEYIQKAYLRIKEIDIKTAGR